MKKWLLLMVLTLVLLTNACTKKTNTTEDVTVVAIEGYVMKMENQKILVVNPKSRPTGDLKEFFDAIWFSNIPDNVKVGQEVQVWSKGEVATSYPGQARVDKLSVLSKEKPPQAKLSEVEVIRKVLQDKEAVDIRVPVIKEIKFNSNTHQWTIQVTDGTKVLSQNVPQEHILQIPDS